MTPQEQVDDWNTKHSPGIVVDVFGNGKPFRAITTSPAAIFSFDHRFAVVKVAPCPPNWGPLTTLDHVRPAEPRGETNQEYIRAGGGATCEKCGKLLYDHPSDLDHVGYDGRPFLHVLCDGSLVKL